jgi:FlaA1/EpsC-like NDP-sugar epimerase
VGIRPGEKLHEQMISPDDAPHTFSYGDYFKILPAIHNWSSDAGRIGDGVPVGEGFDYSSDNNPEWMSVEELQNWITANRAKIGSF